MTKCSFCNAGLSDDDVRAGLCPACGKQLASPGDTVESEMETFVPDEQQQQDLAAQARDEEFAGSEKETYVSAEKQTTSEKETYVPAEEQQAVPAEKQAKQVSVDVPAKTPALQTPDGAGGSVPGDSGSATFDESSPAPKVEGPDTWVSSSIDQTFVTDELPPEIVKTMQATWVESAGSQTDPGKTIKADLVVAGDGDTTIVEPSDTGTGPAQRGRQPDETWAWAATDVERAGGDVKGAKKAPGMETALVIKTRTLSAVNTPSTSGEAPEYELIKILGEGGMGIVYDARQTSIDRSVAIKMLKPEIESTEQRHKFLAEAVVTGDLDHPNIVPIYDVATTAKNALFYSMKQVEGTPWLDVIERKSETENLEILQSVADAVAFAHARGIVHRDLKPENVMLGGFGEVLVMDWGLALPTEVFRKKGSITRTSSMGGTPAYMAPEMATGPIAKIGPSSDVYLLGAILYEIVTGDPPHMGKNAMQCLMGAAKNEILPTDKTGELVDIAFKAMAANPKDRYATVQDFQAAIRDYRSHSESIVLSSRAADELKKAIKSDEYQLYSKACFAFQEAIDLWDGNTNAKTGLAEASLAYAQSAMRKGDYDLGMSLLDLTIPKHAKLHRQLQAGKAEVEARAKQVRFLKRAGVATAATLIVVVTGAAFLINNERAAAVTAKEAAVVAQKEEEVQRKEADNQRMLAVNNLKEAKKQRMLAENNFEEAKKQRMLAEDNFKEAKRQEELAKANAIKAIQQQMIAEENAERATSQEKLAKQNEEKANKQRLIAEKNEAEANRQRQIADDQRKEAVTQTIIARKAKAEEEVQRKKAEAQTKIAVAARENEAYETYIAQIGLAAAKIDENAFDSARDILGRCEKRLRNWEWGRLMFLCGQNDYSFAVHARVESVAVAPKIISASQSGSGNRFRFVTGGDGGIAKIWDIDVSLDGKVITEHQVKELQHNGASVIHAVAISPDGLRVATGSDDKSGYIRLWNADSGIEIPTTFRGDQQDRFEREHTGSVVDVSFSADGKRLLTASLDSTARLWDVDSGRQIQRLPGHYASVRSAAFSPDEKSIVTAGDDGYAFVWTDQTGRWTDDKSVKPTAQFTGHQGPVFAAAFSPDGKLVVTGGYDRRVLIWSPADLKPIDYKKRVTNAQNEKEGRLLEYEEPPEFRTLDGHTAPVRSVGFSHDGGQILSSGHDNTIKVWDVKTGKADTTFRGHDEWVRSCAFSPDGRWILSGSYDQTAKFWTINNYEEIRVLRGRTLEKHKDDVLAASFSQDEMQILTASRDFNAKTWEVETGRLQKSYAEGHEFLASSAAFFPGGKKMATGAIDNTVRIWDITEGTQILLLEGAGSSATLAVSHDGKWILTGSDVRRIGNGAAGRNVLKYWDAKLWNAETGKLVRRLQGHRSEVSAVAFSPDDRWLATGDQTGHCRVWDAATGREVRSLSLSQAVVRTAHNGKIVAVAFLPDGKRILTASSDHLVAQWDVETGRERPKLHLKHPEAVIAMAVSQDGRHVLTSCADKIVRLWDAGTAQEIGTLPVRGGRGTLRANVEREMNKRFQQWDNKNLAELCNLSDDEVKYVRDPRIDDMEQEAENIIVKKLAKVLGVTEDDLRTPRVNALDISEDGQFALTASAHDQHVELWDLPKDGKKISGPGNKHGKFLDFKGRGTRIWSALFSPQGDVLTVGGRTARLWDRTTARERIEFSPHGAVAAASFSPDRKYIVTGSWDHSAKIWDVDRGIAVAKLEGQHTGHVNSAFFSPVSNGILLTAGDDGKAILWDWDPKIKTAKPGRSIAIRNDEGQPISIRHATFSPDGRFILTSSSDNMARIWEVKSGRVLCLLSGHHDPVLCGVFSADGSWVVTGSEDNSARIWKVSGGGKILAKGELMATLQGHTASVTSVAFSPDGFRVLTASQDNTAKLWDTPQAIDAGRNSADADDRIAVREILTLSRHSREVTSVAFSPSGNYVLTGSVDGTAILWLAVDDWKKKINDSDPAVGRLETPATVIP